MLSTFQKTLCPLRKMLGAWVAVHLVFVGPLSREAQAPDRIL
jgi:hypothetical protein